MKNRKICRLCLKTCKANFVPVQETTKNALEVLLVKMDLGISKRPVQCKECIENLQKCSEFKSVCILTEKNVIDVLESRNICKINMTQVYLNNVKINPNLSKMEEVCRFCTARVTKYFTVDELNEDINLSNMVQKFLPEVKLSVTNNPVTCSNCLNSLKDYFTFLKNCQHVEEYIKEYCICEDITKRKVELNDVVQYMLKHIVPERDAEKGISRLKKDVLDELTLTKNQSVETYSSDPAVMEAIKTELIVKEEQIIDIHSADIIDIDTITTKHELVETFVTYPADTRSIVHNKPIVETYFPDLVNTKKYNMKRRSTEDLLLEVKNEDSDDVFSENCSDENNTEDIDLTEIKREDVDIKHNSIYLERDLLLEVKKEDSGDVFSVDCSDENNTGDIDMTEIKTEDVDIKPNSIYLERDLLLEEVRNEDSDDVFSEDCRDENNTEDIDMTEIKTEDVDIKYNSICLERNEEFSDQFSEPLKPYACTGCKQTFTKTTDLDFHILTRHRKDEGLMKTVLCKVHNCNYCSYKSTNISNMTKHMEAHHVIKPHTCTECKKTFCRKRTLANHIVSYHPTNEGLMKTVTYKIHNCDYCSYKSANIASVTKHMETHSEPLKSHICTGCKKTFIQKTNLDHHIVTHHPKDEGLMKTVMSKIHNCYYCSYKSANISHVQNHMETHNEPLKPYTCTGCKKAFIKKANLDLHIVRHHRKDEGLMKTVLCKVHNCDYCSYKSTNIRNMTKHMNAHNELIKPYICTGCKKTFCLKRTLAHHIVSYHPTNEGLMKTVTCKVHNCDYCNYKSANIANVTKHMETHSAPLKSYICTECKKTFIRKTNLDHHIITHHPNDEGLMKTVTCKIHNCYQCSYKSANKSQMTRHMKTHNKLF